MDYERWQRSIFWMYTPTLKREKERVGNDEKNLPHITDKFICQYPRFILDNPLI
jgi:hypothetical protein